MAMFQRLSSGPTIPDLLQAEAQAWRQATMRLPTRRGQMRACFLAASLVLGAARLLLRLRLIEPRCAGAAFGVATTLTRLGLAARHGHPARPHRR